MITSQQSQNISKKNADLNKTAT